MNYLKTIFLISPLLISSLLIFAQEKNIQLPVPDTMGGKPLMETLKLRSTSRSFRNQPMEIQALSDLLWAAYGINRPESGKRTVPSALNVQEFVIYVFTEKGVYWYDAVENKLIWIKDGDFRAKTGTQDFVSNASVNLVYVADYNRMERIKKQEDKAFYAAIDCGFICQNVYLFSASNDLACVVRGSIDKAEMEKFLNLPENMKVIITQSVGYKK